MLIDTHAHLFSYSDSELDGILQRAKEGGVDKLIVPGLNLENSNKAIELARRYPGFLYAAVGIHPEELGSVDNLENSINELHKLIEGNRDYVVAVGEIGTDLNAEELGRTIEQQLELFVAQAKLAVEYDLPIIVHTRKSLPETLLALDKIPMMPKGVFHCFSHDSVGMQQIVDRGYLIGIGGNVGYSKRIQNIAAVVDSKSYVLETDSPFLPRDFLNEPSSVTILASRVAVLRGESVNKVSEDTTNNALRIFNL